MNIFKSLKNKLSRKLEKNLDTDLDAYNPDIGNLMIKNNQVFVDGRELDIQTTSNIHLTQKNGKVLVNGKPPIYKG
jgi:hypothetical protein